MNPATTITNHTPPAPARCCLNPTTTCRVESETAHLGTGTWGWKHALNSFEIHFPGRLGLT